MGPRLCGEQPTGSSSAVQGHTQCVTVTALMFMSIVGRMANPLQLLLLFVPQEEFDDRRHYIKPSPTGATEGHALGAQRTMAAAVAASSGGSKMWKMQRFEKHAQSKILRYVYSGSSPGAKEEEQY